MLQLKRRNLIASGLGLTSSAALVSLSGCASPSVNDYATQTPLLDLKTYFNGVVDAWGVFTDRSGKVVKRFTVVMNCAWSGEVGTLDEDFSYSDGTKQKRIWQLTHQGENKYTGTAGDVVGTAIGECKGNAFHWNYTLALPVDGHVWNVQFDDWMFLMDQRIMLNKARMSKFGIDLGEVTLSFTKRTS
jgi:hypothetical protein